MVRYAQANGNDAICKSIILSKLGEPNIQPVAEVDVANASITTDDRDVGRHAQTVTQLLQQKMNENEKLTLPMLVKEWRVKDSPYDCVKSNPPNKDLTIDECERIVVSLLLEEILAPKIAYTAYSTIMYVVLGQHGHRLIASPNPRVNIRFPKRPTKASNANTEARARKSIASNDSGWIDTKPKLKRKSATTTTKTSKSKPTTKIAAARSVKKRKPVGTGKKAEDLVIELSSDESSDDEPISALAKKTSAAKAASVKDALWDDRGSSDEELEFI